MNRNYVCFRCFSSSRSFFANGFGISTSFLTVFYVNFFGVDTDLDVVRDSDMGLVGAVFFSVNRFVLAISNDSGA